ncbi:MAG: 4-(cytidine 5'-diphospho)-2-C-methyl-D-erythritol kinase [candidate division KSB1 bacterium]|nr:4-(cytidine 5'-diphospho)-2-C-methyl-D-erythritol kinase [candidate division KSB1 bacterium]MDZ7274771.1 4-(cytidine 5'-diphospho)-2-C-methyl-D-erythritol kinase [candidate division KSB1 bacterium]MDZ7285595.1 4-(cytidine 5'-diphospho)-2-C-methyl-D-erythritol kinase [candidate division KSB1 bacterium]MDZ7298627.1 4-(cytidine 5'-diphospho)-2-C-methyl-D-erythritol kinase [candidate division KSB1 bacterium]MDZ7307637.1 4-(cytidine 5'-diphospho)-2-C-methyl-D-erythritol kinase [candidate division
MKAFRVPAYAKINVGLRILGRREDGYHNLDTNFLQISLCDTLFFEKKTVPGFELSCNWPELAIGGSNLCERAYQLLVEASGQSLGVRLHLEKHIPTGAGLGGGSSDAAVTLLAVNQLCHLNFPVSRLAELALQLGSDVPFFLQGGYCRGQGRGEILSIIEQLPEYWILIVTPPVSVSTSWAYQNVKIGLTNGQKSSTFSASKFKKNELSNSGEQVHNDFETLVFEHYPELAVIKQQLLVSKALAASMSGSGSTVFGLYGTREAAQQAQRFFQHQHKTFLARPVKWGKKELDQYVSSCTTDSQPDFGAGW